MDDFYESKKIDKIDLDKLKILFINIYSGEKYDKISKIDNIKDEVNKKNNEEKDKLQEIIYEFKDEQPNVFFN